jgi:hypothetical protein
MNELEKEITVQETLKKMPQFNVEHSINLVFDVNDIAIKSHDQKIDDKY